ncbi:MAG: Arc family DNA-binding protein [Chloroflexota bacterium]|nr:Arc family DNA-binding protein [Chloroflexota bacterium]
MPIPHVRNVPDDLYERLRQRARAENRSLSAEVIHLLEHALQEPARSRREVLDDIRRRRYLRPIEAGLPDSTALIREDRDR